MLALAHCTVLKYHHTYLYCIYISIPNIYILLFVVIKDSWTYTSITSSRRWRKKWFFFFILYTSMYLFDEFLYPKNSVNIHLTFHRLDFYHYIIPHVCIYVIYRVPDFIRIPSSFENPIFLFKHILDLYISSYSYKIFT
jgi:hypothetical protein